MGKEKAQEPLNEYFLKAIFQEKEVPVNDSSLTKKISEMMNFVNPVLNMDKKDDFEISYIVPYDVLKNKIFNEEEAYNLRTHGWVLSDDEKNIVLHLNK